MANPAESRKQKIVDLKQRFVKMRYKGLVELAKELKPRLIMEIGTWDGTTALELLKHSPESKYVGFDMFELATPEFNEKEGNVKQAIPLYVVYQTLRRGSENFLLDEVGDALIEKEREFLLIRGDTRDTLPAFQTGYAEEFMGRGPLDFSEFQKPDLIFIDGGHSVETITSDWRNAKELAAPGATVVFDDYYTPALDGMGCNEVVKDLDYEVMERMDGTKMGVGNQFVKVQL